MEAILEKANKLYNQNFTKKTFFERAIFISWYCDIGNCKFCYMSTQKEKIKDPDKARRSVASILAEIIICRLMGWKVEFISGGYKGFPVEDMKTILKYGSLIAGEKLWLNTGFIEEPELIHYIPYVQGLSASVETVNPQLHRKVCPSKPIAPYLKLFDIASKYNLKRSMTLIIGIGETEENIPETVSFIKENKIDRLTIYALRPVRGTQYTKGPALDYYLRWISSLRIALPKLEIIAGIVENKIDTVKDILYAGANNFTKYPVIKNFKKGFDQVDLKPIGRKLYGEFTHVPDLSSADHLLKIISDPKLREKTEKKVIVYLKQMKK